MALCSTHNLLKLRTSGVTSLYSFLFSGISKPSFLPRLQSQSTTARRKTGNALFVGPRKNKRLALHSPKSPAQAARKHGPAKAACKNGRPPTGLVRSPNKRASAPPPTHGRERGQKTRPLKPVSPHAALGMEPQTAAILCIIARKALLFVNNLSQF